MVFLSSLATPPPPPRATPPPPAASATLLQAPPLIRHRTRALHAPPPHDAGGASDQDAGVGQQLPHHCVVSASAASRLPDRPPRGRRPRRWVEGSRKRAFSAASPPESQAATVPTPRPPPSPRHRRHDRCGSPRDGPLWRHYLRSSASRPHAAGSTSSSREHLPRWGSSI
jgi:hypothetical protein